MPVKLINKFRFSKMPAVDSRKRLFKLLYKRFNMEYLINGPKNLRKKIFWCNKKRNKKTNPIQNKEKNPL